MKNKIRINNKGQAGPIGEDTVYMIVIILAIAALLVVVVKAFADHEVKYAKLDTYRSALITADRISTDLSWDCEGSKRTRILDIKKLDENENLKGGHCETICKNCLGICVIDKNTGENWFCGNPTCKGSLPNPDLVSATIKLPVSIRVDEKEFHPGILEVTVAR